MIIIDQVPMLKIKFCNWQNKKNQGLCDLKEVKQKKKKQFKVSCPGIIYRNLSDYELVFIPKSQLSQGGHTQEFQPLISINSDQGHFKITDLKKIQGHEQPLTLIAPSISLLANPLQDSLLLKDDYLIKIGKVILKVLKTKITSRESQSNFYKIFEKPSIESINKIGMQDYRKQEEKETYQTTQIKIQQVQNSYEKIDNDNISSENYSMYSENPLCKICYSKTIQKNNSLVCFCQCSGSTKFIHEKCLQTWIKQRAEISKTIKDSTTIYCANMNAFMCQICKKVYDPLQALTILFEESKVFDGEYLALRVQDGQKQLAYLVDLANCQRLKIGRDISNHIQISDLTVSREHCQIVYDKVRKTLSIYDLDSKFGTTLKKPSFIIRKQKGFFRFLKGRTFIEIEKSAKTMNRNILQNILICYPQLN